MGHVLTFNARDLRHETYDYSNHTYVYAYDYKPYILMFIRCIYGIVSRKSSVHTAIYGVHIRRVGQNLIYTVFIRYFWQGNHQKYGHIRCIYVRFWPTLHMMDRARSDEAQDL